MRFSLLSIATAVILVAMSMAEAEPTIRITGNYGGTDEAAVASQVLGLETRIKEKGSMWARWENGRLIPSSGQANAQSSDEDFVYSFRISFIPYNRAERIRAAASVAWAPVVTYWLTTKYIFARKADSKRMRVKREAGMIGWDRDKSGGRAKFFAPALAVGLFCLEGFGRLPSNKDGLILVEQHEDWPGPQTSAEKVFAFGAVPITGGLVFLVARLF